MIVQCDSCKRYFDNEFRLTYCPHDTFAANDGKNNFAHHPESYLSSEAPKSMRDHPHLLHWWALTLALLLAVPVQAQDAKVIELKSTDAFSAQKVYDALRKAEKDRDEFEAFIKKTYLVVEEGDADKGSTIVGESGAWTMGCNAIAFANQPIADYDKCKQAEAEWEKVHNPRPKYQYYRAGWENGFVFSRDFRFLVPKPVPLVSPWHIPSCLTIAPTSTTLPVWEVTK